MSEKAFQRYPVPVTTALDGHVSLDNITYTRGGPLPFFDAIYLLIGCYVCKRNVPYLKIF